MVLNSSPERCWVVPAEPKVSLPGCARASAVSSATLFAGTSLLTTFELSGGIPSIGVLSDPEFLAHPTQWVKDLALPDVIDAVFQLFMEVVAVVVFEPDLEPLSNLPAVVEVPKQLTLSYGDLTNPSFLALSPNERFLYSVHGVMVTMPPRSCRMERPVKPRC
jgi:hypothetical protein